MKRTLFSALASAIVIASSCHGNSYVIEGTTTYEDCDGAMVILFNGKDTDTTKINGNSFVFEGEIESPEIGMVHIENGRKKLMFCQFILEPGKMQLEISPSSTCYGTKLNKIYTEYQLEKKSYADLRKDIVNEARKDPTLSKEERRDRINEAWNNFHKNENAFYNKAFAEHNNDIIGKEAMLKLNTGAEVFDSLYNLAGEFVRNHHDVQKEVAKYEQIAKTAVGQPYIDFTVENGNADGSSVKLSDYVGNGKYVLIDFWASWCGPCKAEMPNLANIYAKYKSDKFEILGIAVVDKRENTEKVMPELPITWPVIYDAQRIPVELYSISSIPHIMLVGPDGTILARGIRGEEIAETLEKYLN